MFTLVTSDLSSAWYTSIADTPAFRELCEEIGRLDVQADKLLHHNRWTRPNGKQLIVIAEANCPDAVCRYEYLAGYSPLISHISATVLAPIVAEFLGEPVSLFKDKLNRKAPGGGEFRAHQDIVAYRHFPPSRFVTAMVAIDQMTLANGCLEFAFGYEAEIQRGRCSDDGRGPILATVADGLRHGDILPQVADALCWTSAPAEPGDIIVFDSYLPHRSARNNTGSARRALFLTYTPAADGDWYEEYYLRKRRRPDDPIFHVSTPTLRRAGGSAKSSRQ